MYPSLTGFFAVVMCIAGFIAIITFLSAAMRKKDRHPTLEEAAKKLRGESEGKCPECGAAISDERDFCPGCGKQVEKTHK